MSNDVRLEADKLLESPTDWEKSAYARGAKPFGHPDLFSKTMPEMSDADWAVRDAEQRSRWEVEKASARAGQYYLNWAEARYQSTAEQITALRKLLGNSNQTDANKAEIQAAIEKLGAENKTNRRGTQQESVTKLLEGMYAIYSNKIYHMGEDSMEDIKTGEKISVPWGEEGLVIDPTDGELDAVGFFEKPPSGNGNLPDSPSRKFDFIESETNGLDFSTFKEGADKWAAQVLKMPDEDMVKYREFSGPDARNKAITQLEIWKLLKK